MTTLSPEDIAALRELDERVTAGEAAQLRCRAKQEELVAALRREFAELKARAEDLEIEVADLRESVESLHAGRAGEAGKARIDPRVIEKLGKFSGTQEEWRDWSDSFRSFVAVLDLPLASRIEVWRAFRDLIAPESMDAADKKHSVALWHMLTILSKRKAGEKRRSTPNRCGLETWGLFYLEYQPHIPNRLAGLLSSLLATTFTGSSSEELDKFELRVHEYEAQSQETVGDHIKHATVMNGLQEGTALATHV